MVEIKIIYIYIYIFIDSHNSYSLGFYNFLIWYDDTKPYTLHDVQKKSKKIDIFKKITMENVRRIVPMKLMKQGKQFNIYT